MALFKQAPRLTAATTLTPTGSSVAPNFIISQATVLYVDSAPGNTIQLQGLMSDGVTWVIVQSITTLASGQFSIVGAFLDLRAAVTAHTVSGNIAVDISALG